MNQLVHVNDIHTMAVAVVKSGLFGIKTVEQATALMLIAQAEGYHPALAARDYHIIQGRPTLKAETMMARFQQQGGKVDWKTLTDEEVTATFSHPSGGSATITWTIEQAKKANLTGKDNWKKHPENMLHARCVSNGVRFVYPQATGGMYDPTEVADFAEKTTAWDTLKPATVVDGVDIPTPAPVPDAEFTELEQRPEPENPHPATTIASDGPMLLEMPGNDCDRLPKDVRRLKRSLPDTPFAEMDLQTLRACIQSLKDMGRRAKQDQNRAVMTVLVAIMEAEEGKRNA